jgi:hypothetical protein
MNLNELIKKRPQLPPRILIYTIPGWGKSTLASSMPRPIFIDAEDGLTGLDVDAFPLPKTFDSVIGYLDMLINETHEYKTVVIDTLSSIEKFIFNKVCVDHKKNSIEAFGYARGYAFAMDHWHNVIEKLDVLRKKGIAPALLAHSEVKTVNDPIIDSYDRYILRLHKHPAAMITQWVDNLLFGTYRTVVANTGQGFTERGRGVGQGERVIYTEERPAFSAKSRIGLPFEIEVPKTNGWSAIMNNKINEEN